MNSSGYERFQNEASQFGSIAEGIEFERKSARLKSKQLQPKIYKILKKKEFKLNRREKTRLPKIPANSEGYVDVLTVPLLGRMEEFEEQRRAIALMTTKMREKALELLKSMLDDDQIESIRELPQRLRKKQRDMLIRLVQGDLLLWILDEFNIKRDCPLCPLKFPKNHPKYRAVHHIQEHLNSIVAKAVKMFV